MILNEFAPYLNAIEDKRIKTVGLENARVNVARTSIAFNFKMLVRLGKIFRMRNPMICCCGVERDTFKWLTEGMLPPDWQGPLRCKFPFSLVRRRIGGA